ncbi:hypothetical protein Aperf_G00000043718 [Anoplocephala perfoliata]
MGKKFNTRCYLDVKIGDSGPERIVLELFDEKCPKACDNFKKLCEGGCGIGMKTGKQLHYKGSSFHRIIKGFIIQGGDFSNGDGTGGESIYGGTFADEDMSLLHDRPFLLSMANRGPNTNGSQFFITTAPAPHLNGKHMVFGHVLSGQEVVAKIEAVPVSDTRVYKPIKPVIIANCGELIPVKKKKSKESKKLSKKKRRDRKKSKKRKERRRHSSSKNSGSESDSVKVRPEEIPDVPQNKFLFRPGPSNPTGILYGSNQDNAFIDKSGRKVKGRGQVRYRSPNTYPESYYRSHTPEHWRQASRQETYRRPLKDDPRDHANRFREAMGISKDEGVTRAVKSRSPLNGHEESSVKSRKNRGNNYENTRVMSPGFRERQRSHDRSDRKADCYDARWARKQDLSPPDRRRRLDYSSQNEDERIQRRRQTPSPLIQPSRRGPSRDYNNSHAENRQRNASSSRREYSPSPSTRWQPKRKRMLSSSSEVRPSKRPNDHDSSTRTSSKTSPVRRRDVIRETSRGNDTHGTSPVHQQASRSPPPYLVNKWEERRKEMLRKRDSMNRTSARREDNSPRHRRDSSSSSISRPRSKRTSPVHSTSSPIRQHAKSPLLREPPSPTNASPKKAANVFTSKKPVRSPLPSPIKPTNYSKSEDSRSNESKSSHKVASHSDASPTSTGNRECCSSPSSRADGEEQHSQADKKSELKNKEIVEKTGGSREADIPQEAGPWTTSHWQTDDPENGSKAPSNSSIKKSPVKLALGTSNSEALTQPVDMEVSEAESNSNEAKKALSTDTKKPEVPVENKSPSPTRAKL